MVPLHNKLRKLPIVGAVGFSLINLIVYLIWNGAWQFLTVHLILTLVMLEYLFLAISRNQKLQVTVKLNQKLFLIGAYVCLCGVLIFPAFPNMHYQLGKNPVGTWKLIVESSERTETMAQIDGVKRRFAIQLFYPISNKSGAQKKWFESETSVKGMALSYGMPELLVSHLNDIDSGVYLSKKIQVKEVPYQVIVISHGLKSSSEQYTRLAKQLAAKGYLVSVINHPYSAYASVFSKKDCILGAQSPVAQIDFVDQKIELEKQMTLIQQGDLMETFKVLDQLNQGNYDNRFKKMLDLSDITLVGHQIGGGAVVTTLNQVSYAKTGILLNPVVEQIPKKYILEGSEKPILALVSKDYLDSNNSKYLMRYLEGSKDCIIAESERGKDLDMTDLSQVSTLFRMSGLSDGRSASQKMIDTQVAFVDQAVQKYSQGQIFEEISKNLDLARLGITLLEPEAIDAN
jgi:hypothetical protein